MKWVPPKADLEGDRESQQKRQKGKGGLFCRASVGCRRPPSPHRHRAGFFLQAESGRVSASRSVQPLGEQRPGSCPEGRMADPSLFLEMHSVVCLVKKTLTQPAEPPLESCNLHWGRIPIQMVVGGDGVRGGAPSVGRASSGIGSGPRPL